MWTEADFGFYAATFHASVSPGHYSHCQARLGVYMQQAVLRLLVDLALHPAQDALDPYGMT